MLPNPLPSTGPLGALIGVAPLPSFSTAASEILVCPVLAATASGVGLAFPNILPRASSYFLSLSSLLASSSCLVGAVKEGVGEGD